MKFAIRQLLKNPGFTAVAAITLALGIGATTATVSVLRTALFDPLPMKNPERFLDLLARHQLGGWLAGLNPIAAREAEAATNLFSTVALSVTDNVTLETGGFPQQFSVFRVTHGFFRLTRSPFLLGRPPTLADYRPAAPGVIVLGHELWQSIFGGDPEIVGRLIRFKEADFAVIGVMKPGFRFPSTHGAAWVAWSGPPVMAGDAFAADRSLSLPSVSVQVELRPGVTVDQVQAWLALLQARQREMDTLQKDFEFIGQSMAIRFSKPELRRTLWMLFAVSLLVLLIASANLANLQLVRIETRRQELAVRAALGADRRRVVRQLLLESLALAASGGAAGILVARLGIDMLVAFLPVELPRLRPFGMDWGVFGIASTITLITGLAFGVGPAWRGGQTDLNACLKCRTTGDSGRQRRFGFAGALVVGQVALAFTLLAGAGLMSRSAYKFLTVDVGFDPTHLVRLYPYLDLQFFRAGSPEASASKVQWVYDDLQQRLTSIPGAVSVGISQGPWQAVDVVTENGTRHQLEPYSVRTGSADPLLAIKARLKAGRWLSRADEETMTAVLVNEAAAGRLWPDGKAVGRSLRLKWPEASERTVEIVGVVTDLRENAYGETVRPTFFAPISTMKTDGPGIALSIRTAVPFESIRASVEQHLRAVGAAAARPTVVPVDQLLGASAADRRTFAKYLTALAGTGLGLATLGLYGVLAFNVGQRTREVGIRMALGSTTREVVTLVLRQGLVLVLFGSLLGILGAFTLGRLLRSFLFDVEANDPATLATVGILLAAVALLACWLPARRAARVDPVVALRME